MIASQGFDGCVPDDTRYQSTTMTEEALRTALEDPETVVRIWHWLATEPWCSHEVEGDTCLICGAGVADWEQDG